MKQQLAEAKASDEIEKVRNQFANQLKTVKESLERQEAIFQKQLLLKRGIVAEAVKLNLVRRKHKSRRAIQQATAAKLSTPSPQLSPKDSTPTRTPN